MTDTRVHQLDPDEITLGTRFREDYGDLTDLKDSIMEHGLIQPITVTRDLVLIAGGRRYRAARELKLDTIPAIVRDTEAEVDLREIELDENICRKDLEWHERCSLEKRILELKREKHGWDQKTTAAYLHEAPSQLSRHLELANAIEVVPELREAKTEDAAWKTLNKIKENIAVRELNERKNKGKSPLAKVMDESYLVGDAIEGMASISEKEIFAFAEVDPPYGINLTQQKMGKEEDPLEFYQEVDPKEYGAFATAAAKQVYRLLKPDSFAVWWFGPSMFDVVFRALKRAKFEIRPIPAIWTKKNPNTGSAGGQSMQPHRNLANSYEPFFVIAKGNPTLTKQGRSNVFEFIPVHSQQKFHPTQRPVQLMKEILGTFTVPGSRVLCPFLGSGVTIKASWQSGMTCLGWDLSKENKRLAMVDAEL